MPIPPNLEYIVPLFNNLKLKKIVNVYQKQYINSKGQGFGDFLRGSIYLTYICKLLNLEFDIDISNHPMSKFLSHYQNPQESIDYNNIRAYIYPFDEKMYIDILMNSLNECDTATIYLFVNFQPTFNIENPNYGIINISRDIIIPKIQPIDNILSIMDSRLQEINLSRKKYAVIHIRCGDYFMNIQKNIDTKKHQISNKHVYDIICFLKNYCNKDRNYIVIGDSDKIKKIVSNNFKNVHMFNTSITHLGEDDKTDDKPIIDTIIDFNIMRFSNFIISFTAYGHGSGFSKYSAVMYDIPFKQILLQPILLYKT